MQQLIQKQTRNIYAGIDEDYTGHQNNKKCDFQKFEIFRVAGPEHTIPCEFML